MSDKQYDVIVGGVGCGSASCAGLLARLGMSVRLVEMNKVASGTGTGTQRVMMAGFNVAYAVEKRYGTSVAS
jgi:glycerol-3-phosphate dehydrogenase